MNNGQTGSLRRMDVEATMTLPQGADYSLTENALIPFQAEPTRDIQENRDAGEAKWEFGIVEIF